MKKSTIIIIAVAVVIILTILVILKKQGKIGTEPGIKVSTEVSARRSIIGKVSANGRIQPATEVIINPDASGEIVQLSVKEGDLVKKGDLLAKINPEFYQSSFDRSVAALNTQRANLANAKARLSQVEAQFINTKLSHERNQSLWETRTISKAEYDASNAQFDVAKAEVDAAKQSVLAASYTVRSSEAAVQESRDYLRKTSIYAPMDGTVSSLNKELGERVAGASQFSPGTEMMRIANLQEMEVNVEVSENDIIRVSLYDTADIEVDAYPDRKFKGVVTEMANSAQASLTASVDQVTNFDVRIMVLRESYIDLIDPEKPEMSPFRPGMSATVDIRTEYVDKVITVPIQSVTTKSDTTGLKEDDEVREVLFVYEDGKVKMLDVVTGIQDDTYIEIKEGLGENEEVVSAPYRAIHRKLEDGDRVRKVPEKLLFEKD